MPTALDRRDVGEWTMARGPRVAAVPWAATEVRAGGRPFRAETAGSTQGEVNEQANPGRPGDAKPQISPVEMAGLPKRLQRSATQNFLEVQ
jgi:hypothetical protein